VISSHLKPAAIRFLVLSQLTFFGAVGICILLAPASLEKNVGLSYFGVHVMTVFPYTIGLLMTAYFLYRCQQLLVVGSPVVPKLLVLAFQAMVLLTIGIVLTPYSLDDWLNWVHTGVGSSLFSIQLLLSIWLVLTFRRDWLDWSLLALLFLSGLMALLDLAPENGFLLQYQLIFQMIFAILIYRNLDWILAKVSLGP